MVTKKRSARESALDPNKLARVFLNNHAKGAGNQWTLRYWRGEWWRWRCCSYNRQSRDELKVSLAAALKKHIDSVSLLDGNGNLVKVTPDLVSKVTLALSATVYVAEDAEMPQWLDETASTERDSVTVKNGIVELFPDGHRELRKHTPAWFTAVCLPQEYDAGATAPKWNAFLDEVLEGDAERIGLLQEWFGYSLVYDTKLHKFMMLEGDGANGKSVVLEILRVVLGEDNVAAVPLELFGQRFQLTPTLHKLANIAPETDERARVDLGTLKQFVGGEMMQWDRKGIEQIQARPTARLIVATNNRPAFADRSSGLWRRLLLIPFRVTIAPEHQDPDLVNKLKGELPGRRRACRR
jgi:putative DNA primase/helicase